MPASYLTQKLTQALPTKDGAVLRTIGEAANYILALPHEQAEHCNRWRHAAKLFLDQADVAAVSRQVYLVLFYDAKLDIGAMGPLASPPSSGRRPRLSPSAEPAGDGGRCRVLLGFVEGAIILRSARDMTQAPVAC